MFKEPKVLILDNYDSFTWNLLQLVKEAGHACDVVRSDNELPKDIDTYTHLIISPGPGHAAEYTRLLSVNDWWGSRPLLGVCLGMQALAIADGQSLVNLDLVRHGAIGLISRSEPSVLFEGLPWSFKAGLYHSWAVASLTSSSNFVITARDEEGVIMAMDHKKMPWSGVQFHPESIMTEHRLQIVSNFIRFTGKTRNHELPQDRLPEVASE
ncbi:MAG: aminodeoxychorismate/anthranilate synthase component II [Salibacteraceae bacterium]